MSTTPTETPSTGAFAWFRTLGAQGRRAFVGAFGGYALDSYDYQVLPLSLAAISAAFALTTGQAGLLATTTLVVSAIGGALAGVLADRIGRVQTLLITIITYAVFTVACGFATSYEMLLVFRALQGLGFGGEWAAGAVLVAEYCRPEHRGRALAWVQSAWAVGWGLCVIVYTVVFSLVGPELGWRVLFWTGALPALLVLYVRWAVKDAPEAEARRKESTDRGSFPAIFRGPLLRTTVFAVAAGHRRAGRLLRAVHLAADLPQDRARPLRHRHRRLPVLPHHRRVRRLHLRRLRHRPAGPQEDVRAVRGAVGGC